MQIQLQLTLIISTSLISNDRLFRNRNFVPFSHEDLATRNKILWIKAEIAPEEQFHPFSTILVQYL